MRVPAREQRLLVLLAQGQRYIYVLNHPAWCTLAASSPIFDERKYDDFFSRPIHEGQRLLKVRLRMTTNDDGMMSRSGRSTRGFFSALLFLLSERLFVSDTCPSVT